jgi:hypothetical protein
LELSTEGMELASGHLVAIKDPWDGRVAGSDTIQRYSHIDMVDGMDTIDGELRCGADLMQYIPQ